METEHKGYYAIIPAYVRYDEDLIPNAKLLYGEITALCNSKGYCWSRNDYFAQLYNVNKVTISRWISQLLRKEYISSEIIYRENSKEVLERRLRLNDGPIRKIVNPPQPEGFLPIDEKINTPQQNSIEPLNEKAKANTTVNSTTNNTNNKSLSLWKEFIKEQIPEFNNTKEVEAFLKEVDRRRPGIFDKDLSPGVELKKEFRSYSLLYLQGKRTIKVSKIDHLLMDFSSFLLGGKSRQVSKDKESYKPTAKTNEGFIVGQKHNAAG